MSGVGYLNFKIVLAGGCFSLKSTLEDMQRTGMVNPMVKS